MPILEIQQLEAIRRDNLLFQELSFIVNQGELVQIDGENGCGKSTLLRMIAGLSLPSEGDVLWQGKSIKDQRLEFQQQLTYSGHLNGIKESLTVRENLVLMHALSGRTETIKYADIISRLGLSGMDEILAGKMSAGQKRRVGLCRLLINASRLWILDEPFTSLDVYGKEIIESLIDEQCRRQGMVIFATHQPVEVAGQNVRHIHLGGERHD